MQGYDISFLVTNYHCEEMQKHKLIDFIAQFMEASIFPNLIELHVLIDCCLKRLLKLYLLFLNGSWSINIFENTNCLCWVGWVVSGTHKFNKWSFEHPSFLSFCMNLSHLTMHSFDANSYGIPFVRRSLGAGTLRKQFSLCFPFFFFHFFLFVLGSIKKINQ